MSVPARVALGLLLAGAAVAANDTQNLTGLPAYPSLTGAVMDDFSRTDKMGHWCTRFSAQSSNSLDAVETWYRKNLHNPSETDLINDDQYKNYSQLVGIKLALGIDYVTVFRTANRSTTSIELVRCSPL